MSGEAGPELFPRREVMEMWHWEHTKHVHHQLSDIPAGFSNLPLIPAATEDLLKKDPVKTRPVRWTGQGRTQVGVGSSEVNLRG